MSKNEFDLQSERLLSLATAGDMAAVDQLLCLHRQQLCRMVAARMDPRLSARIDASDVVQETFAEAYRQIDAYLKDRPIPFYPWLRQLAWNRMVDQYRRHVLAEQRTVAREERDLRLPDGSAIELTGLAVDSGTSPSDQMSRKERAAAVHVALDKLPPEDRNLIIMRHVEKLRTSEVATILGISDGAVKTRLVRALQKFREQVARTGGGL